MIPTNDADKNIHRRSVVALAVRLQGGPELQTSSSGCPRTIPRHRARPAATAGRRTLRGNEVAGRLPGRNSAGAAQGSAHQQLRHSHRRHAHSAGATLIWESPAQTSFPTVGGVGSIQNDQSTPLFTGSPWIDTLGLQMNYIVDFWGQYRRATEAARANLLATEYAQECRPDNTDLRGSQLLFRAPAIRCPAEGFRTNC